MDESVTIWGKNEQEVLKAIRERKLCHECGGAATDGRKLGLVIEGGGMRGVISGGALLALEWLGMTRVFDAVYGTSAGAINGAYFLAEQVAYGITVYYHDICNSRFINHIRAPKVVDIDYLFDTILASVKPLNVERVLASPSQLFVTLTDAQTGEALLVQAQQHDTPLLTLLKASTALPVIYNQEVQINGRAYVDGAIANQLPLQDAIDDGCTDVLVLLTRPASYVEERTGFVERLLFKHLSAREHSRLLEAYLQNPLRCMGMRDLALGRQPLEKPINIATICPGEQDTRIQRTTKRAELLKAAAVENTRRTLAAFESTCTQLVEVLQPYPQ